MKKLIIAILLFATSVFGADHYYLDLEDDTGGDGSSGNPWSLTDTATIWTTAGAGDVLHVLCDDGDCDSSDIWNWGSSGTAGSNDANDPLIIQFDNNWDATGRSYNISADDGITLGSIKFQGLADTIVLSGGSSNVMDLDRGNIAENAHIQWHDLTINSKGPIEIDAGSNPTGVKMTVHNVTFDNVDIATDSTSSDAFQLDYGANVIELNVTQCRFKNFRHTAIRAENVGGGEIEGNFFDFRHTNVNSGHPISLINCGTGNTTNSHHNLSFAPESGHVTGMRFDYANIEIDTDVPTGGTDYDVAHEIWNSSTIGHVKHYRAFNNSYLGYDESVFAHNVGEAFTAPINVTLLNNAVYDTGTEHETPFENRECSFAFVRNSVDADSLTYVMRNNAIQLVTVTGQPDIQLREDSGQTIESGTFPADGGETGGNALTNESASTITGNARITLGIDTDNGQLTSSESAANSGGVSLGTYYDWAASDNPPPSGRTPDYLFDASKEIAFDDTWPDNYQSYLVQVTGEYPRGAFYYPSAASDPNVQGMSIKGVSPQ